MKITKKDLQKYIDETVKKIVKHGTVSESFDNQISQTSDTDLKGKSSEYMDIKMDFVDLGFESGTLWARKNLGAPVPEKQGRFYKYDRLKDKLKPYMTIPTSQQFEELLTNTFQYPIVDKVTDTRGFKLVSKKNGKSIFFPINGYFENNKKRADYIKSYYWSETEHSFLALNYVMLLDLKRKLVYTTISDKSNRLNVRPVYKG